MHQFFQRMEPSGRRLLLVCFYAFFCSGLVSLTQGSVMPDLKQSRDLSDSFSGLLLSAHSAGNLAGSLISGIAALYLGRRRTIVCFSSLAFAGMAIMALTGQPALLLMAFALAGVGRGSITNFNTRTVNEITDGSPAASNLLHASFAVGAIAAPVVFLLLSRALSWHAGLFFVAACGALAVALYARTGVPDDRPDRKKKEAGNLDFLKEPAFLVFAGMIFCYICSEYAINGWLVTYLQHKETLFVFFGAEEESARAGITAYSQSMAALLWAVILAGRLFCAWLSRRIPQKLLMLSAAFGMSGCFAGMLLAETVPAVTACIAGTGFCMAGICPMIYSDAAYYTNTYPLATGVLIACGAAGGMLMPALVGILAQSGGFESSMTAILISVALLTALSAVNIRMKKHKGEHDL